VGHRKSATALPHSTYLDISHNAAVRADMRFGGRQPLSVVVEFPQPQRVAASRRDSTANKSYNQLAFTEFTRALHQHLAMPMAYVDGFT